MGSSFTAKYLPVFQDKDIFQVISVSSKFPESSLTKYLEIKICPQQ